MAGSRRIPARPRATLSRERIVQGALALAGVRLAQRRPDAAAQLLQRAMRRLDPKTIASIQAMERLVEVRLLAGDMDEAQKALAGLQEASCDGSWAEAGSTPWALLALLSSGA